MNFMLKNRDDIDLKQLEKYGFDYDPVTSYYEKKINDCWWHIIIIDKNREIFEMMKDFDWWSVTSGDESSFNKNNIKDLIKENLVEKVEDK